MAEVAATLQRDWEGGESDSTGFAEDFAATGGTFGEIRDLKCSRKEAVFSCMVGATYALQGVPKYSQVTVRFERASWRHYQLRRHGEDELELN
jgi:hypothetical protein